MVVNPARNATPHMIFINGGSQRFDVFKGPFTYDTSFLISPFTSRFLFARDVPYSVASRLLEYFNKDPSPYYHTDTMKQVETTRSPLISQGETPAWDDKYDYANVLLEKMEKNRRKGINRGIDDLQHIMSTTSDDEDNSSAPHPPITYRRILGYTTIDDHGTTGDDTVHLPFAKYPSPKVIQSNASFPDPDFESEPETVDVVFFDFIRKNVEAGLNEIAQELGMEQRWKWEEFERYMPKEMTLTRLILDFVGTYWGKDCRKK